jgi:hypothetical protein
VIGTSRLSCLSRFALAVIVISVAIFGSPARALGDPALDRLIVQDPIRGWQRLPNDGLQQIVSLEERALSAIGGSVTAAAQGSKHGHDVLLIVLVAVSTNVPLPGNEGRQGVIGLCSGLTSNPPASLTTFRAIPTASEGHCSGRGSSGRRVSVTALSWAKGNVLAYVAGSGLPAGRFESIAKKQYRAIPKAGIASGGSSNA